MRKASLYLMERSAAVALLERAPAVQIASTTPDGRPVLRTVHGVVLDDAIAFHAAPVGEKSATIGREATVGADEVVAQIPSYFMDPERACPATTYYRSVHVRGTLRAVEDPARKARMLQVLMERFQPEGGHVPITIDNPLYRRVVDGLLVAEVSLADITGKSKLGQNLRADVRGRILEQLWARGDRGDPAAIEAIRGATPDKPDPSFLCGPAGARLCTTPSSGADANAVAALLTDQYWTAGASSTELRDAHLGSTAWVAAHDDDGRLIASARAVADGARHAMVYDVIVCAEWRGRGLGRAITALLLDHPRVRRCRMVRLGTRDAQGLYRRLGFADERPVFAQMLLDRRAELRRTP